MIRFVLTVILSISSFVAHAEDPETKVTISVFDLVNRSKRPKMTGVNALTRQYVLSVLELIRNQKKELVNCVPDNSKFQATIRIEIDPSGSGRATPILSQANQAACMQTILTELKYPPHKLNDKVRIELPLVLERRNL